MVTMYDRYLTGPQTWWKYLPVIVIVGAGLRFWLGPRELRGPLDAGILAVWGIAAMFGGDRYGLTQSKSRGVRVLGRLIGVGFGLALLGGAYRVLNGW